jgi:hypothetical protein
MLGHASIVLTADTYTSVLPDVARRTAEAIAAEILQAARTPPGCHRPSALPRPHPAPPHERRAVQGRRNPSSGRVGRPGARTRNYGLKAPRGRLARPISNV